MPEALRLPLLVIVAFIAALLAAVTGFGGAAVLLPMLVFVFGVREAIPILTVAQLIGNASRVWFNRHDLDWRVVAWFAVGGVPMALAGGFLFAHAPLAALTHVLGAFLILIVVLRHLPKLPAFKPPLKSFALIGAAASFLSALLGSVGPLMAPFFLAYGLVKGAYIGTEALSTVLMHAAKLIAYRQSAILPFHTVVSGLALGPIMVAGSFAGKRVVDRLPERVFVLIIDVTLVAAGVLFVAGWSKL
ncbi:MAG TPA: sulfite exporter TauE/SafE family protein [Terracidiphilus sp.]|nr:sulfite exporter TauE/SafE family protein [Terracidiphilus sp.]